MADRNLSPQRKVVLQASEIGDLRPFEELFGRLDDSGLSDDDVLDLNIAIRHAAKHHQVTLVEYLLDKKYSNADTVLTYVLTGAIWGESIPTLELMLKRGWDINGKEAWDGKLSLR